MTNTTAQIEQLVVDMSQKSLDTNASIIKQMQEQVSFSTTQMSNLTQSIENAVSKLAQQMETSNNCVLQNQELSQTKSNECVSLLMANTTSQIEQLVGDLSQKSLETNASIIKQMQEQIGTNTTMMNNLTQSIESIIYKLAQQTEITHNNIFHNQEKSQALSQKTLNSFAETAVTLDELISGVKNTLNQFIVLQQETNKTSSHMSELSRNALSSTITLRESQNEFINEVKENTQKSIEAFQRIEASFDAAKDLPQEYVQKFGTIRDSLAQIFISINDGLNQYSRTVQSNTQEMLDGYSKSVTDSVSKLSGAINELGEIIEDMPSSNHKAIR